MNLGSIVSKLARLLRSSPAEERPPEEPNSMLTEYVDAMPHPQAALDLVAGWNHELPPEAGATTGSSIVLWADGRIEWCLEQFGDLKGCRVLELGPLEGSHTYMLHKRQPSAIDAIEANKLAFLRCLIVKNLLDLRGARFLLGDFQKWLEASGQRYDLIVASGVLYHLADPVRLLASASACTDAIYIWTHYFDTEQMPIEDTRRGAFSGEVTVRPFRGIDVRLHHRSYHGAWRDKAFCGGGHDDHTWMEKDQIIEVLKVLGFADIRVAHDTNVHPAGPNLSIFARRARLTA